MPPFGAVRLLNLTASLDDYWAFVILVRAKMYGASAYFASGCKNRFVYVRSPHTFSAEARQQCRVYVHHSVLISRRYLPEAEPSALDDEVKVSAHAAARLSQRGIHLGDKEMDQVRAGLDVARSKGIKSSLVVVSNAALVVNVGSRTVVTALPHRDLEDAAFTNIDGAVFVGAF